MHLLLEWFSYSLAHWQAFPNVLTTHIQRWAIVLCMCVCVCTRSAWTLGSNRSMNQLDSLESVWMYASVDFEVCVHEKGILEIWKRRFIRSTIFGSDVTVSRCIAASMHGSTGSKVRCTICVWKNVQLHFARSLSNSRRKFNVIIAVHWTICFQSVLQLHLIIDTKLARWNV